MYTDLLQTFAEVAATLAGFIGVVFVLGRRSEGHLTARESSALFHLLFTALGALFFSLVTPLFLGSTVDENVVWRVANGASGLYHLLGVGRASLEALRGHFGVPKAFTWMLFSGSYTLIPANFATAAGYFPEVAPIVFMLGLIWFLVVTAVTFVSLLSMGGRAA